MRVAIVTCSMPGYWYKGLCGREFEVIQICSGLKKYEVLIQDGKTGFVDFSDAEVIIHRDALSKPTITTS